MDENINNTNNNFKTKRLLSIMIIILFIVLIIFSVYYVYMSFFNKPNQHEPSVYITNPMEDIEFKTTNKSNIINEGINNFNETFIAYLLASLGANKLHKSDIGYGSPKIEMNLDNEIWNAELKDYFLINQGNIENEDILIKISKEEAIRALMSDDIKGYLKNSVNSGNTELIMVSGKIELFSKGYLNMYKEITGEEAKI